MRPKRLDIFILKSFLLLFVAAFAICLFVLLMNVLWRYAEDIAAEYVRKAEEECYNLCEECGTPIGTDESPRCCTLGWYRYLCRDCAMRHEEGTPPARYEMNGKFYEGDKEIPSPFEPINKKRK